MRRDPLVSIFVALASVTVCTVVVWLLFFRPTHVVVHERTRTGPTLVVKGQALRPLQARRAKRTSAARSPDSRGGSDSSTSSEAPKSAQALPGARIRPSTPTRRKKATGKIRKPSAGSGGGSQTTPAPPAQPAPRKPLVGVTVPAPVTVCAHPLATVNC